MPVCDFAYHRPHSLNEACALAESLGPEARFLAGGTELLPEFRRGRDRARHLISLREVPDLGEIRSTDGFLRIGAMVPLEVLSRSTLVREAFPVLAEAAAAIGSVQIRSHATLGGNFCGAVPCADTPPACLVGCAQVRIVGERGERVLQAEEFFLGPRQTALEPGEILAEILIPLPPASYGAAYARFGLRRGLAVAVASVAAGLRLEDGVIHAARVALGAVAPVPLLAQEAAGALLGQPPGPEVFEQAAAAAAREARPISDARGSEDYRRTIVAVLARRALQAAATRALGGAA